MRDQLDDHGDFKCNMDGTLEFEDFLHFRSVVMRQSCRMFNPKKEGLNMRKLEIFKAKDQAAYIKIFREGQTEFNRCIMTTTSKACEWIELDIKNY